jgi:hypothetical protein
MLETITKLELAQEIIKLREELGDRGIGECEHPCMWHAGDCACQRTSQCNFGVESSMDDLDRIWEFLVYTDMEDSNDKIDPF